LTFNGYTRIDGHCDKATGWFQILVDDIIHHPQAAFGFGVRQQVNSCSNVKNDFGQFLSLDFT
jgi:hypothetical protein